MFIKLTISIILLFFICFINSSPTLAQDFDSKREIVYETVNPKDGFKYKLKRGKEKMLLSFFSIFPEKKVDLYINILDARLAELKYIAENKDIANIELGSQRYSAHAGDLTSYVLADPSLKDKKSVLITLFENHLSEIKNYQNGFEGTRAEWRFLEDDYNSLKSYISKLSE